MVTSPIEHFNQALVAQVPSGQVPAREYYAFPPPLGPWMARGKPLYFRNQLRYSKVTPSGLLHYWLVKHSFRLKIETWTKRQIEKRYATWPASIQVIYNRDRSAFADLITVRGKLSDRSCMVCARYGAWRAIRALEVGNMPMSEFSWAGLSIPCIGGVLDIKAEGYTLISDNYRGRSELDGTVYAALELFHLLEAGSDALATVAGVKAVFGNARVTQTRDQPEPVDRPASRPGSIQTRPSRYRKTA